MNISAKTGIAHDVPTWQRTVLTERMRPIDWTSTDDRQLAGVQRLPAATQTDSRAVSMQRALILNRRPGAPMSFAFCVGRGAYTGLYGPAV